MMSSSESQASAAVWTRSDGDLTSRRSIQADRAGGTPGATSHAEGILSLTWRNRITGVGSSRNGGRPTICS